MRVASGVMKLARVSRAIRTTSWAVLDLPRMIHPTIWLPRGRPWFACKDSALDRVTRIASRVMPIWTPTIVLETWFGDEGFPERPKSERTKSSMIRYKTPTITINAPPITLGHEGLVLDCKLDSGRHTSCSRPHSSWLVGGA